VPESWEQAKDKYDAAKITDDGYDLADAGVKRPSSTWTYLVHDNPFGSGLEETMKGLVKMVRGQRR